MLQNIYAMPLVLTAAALPVFIIGRRLNQQPGRILVDPVTGEKVELKKEHSMFWIPLRYWSLIIVLIGLWMYLANAGYIYNA